LIKLLLTVALIAVGADADVLYTTTAGSVDNLGHTDAAEAVIFLSNAPSQTCGASGGCVLNIELINLLNSGTYPTISTIAQGISGLTFSLTTISTSLNFNSASLSGTVTSDGGTGLVPTLNPTGTTSAKDKWAIGANPHIGTGTGNWGPGGLELTVLGNGQPIDLIVPSGASAGTSGFTAHNPEWEGPVYFQITGIAGLTTATTISNVDFLFGTSAEGVATQGSCASSGGGNCTLGTIGTSGPTPEPFSFLLAGGGLIGLAFMRRRPVSAK